MLGILDYAEQLGNEVYVFAQAKKDSNILQNRKFYRIGKEFWLRVHVRLARDTGLEGCFSILPTLQMIHQLKKIKPDIIHLHNLHGWCVNLPLLFLYIKKNHSKVIWTLHDCWSFTGHCPHFVVEKCEKWKTGCYDCPRYQEYPASRVDQSAFLWRMKRKCFTSINDMTIVTPSRWLAALVKQSFFKDYPVCVINNGIDLSIFKPQKSEFRKEYNCENKFVVLGVSFDWSYKKGLDVFIEMRKALDDRFAIVLVGVDDSLKEQLGNGFITIRRTNSKEELAQIYSAADVFANPTREDTFPTVNVEALACGTPIITFPTGGSPEIINNTCGIVTNTSTSIDMVEGVLCMYKVSPLFSEESCCQRAKQFEQKNCFEAYVKLYEAGVENVEE